MRIPDNAVSTINPGQAMPISATHEGTCTVICVSVPPGILRFADIGDGCNLVERGDRCGAGTRHDGNDWMVVFAQLIELSSQLLGLL